jgi:hypothetical protein
MSIIEMRIGNRERVSLNNFIRRIEIRGREAEIGTGIDISVDRVRVREGVRIGGRERVGMQYRL